MSQKVRVSNTRWPVIVALTLSLLPSSEATAGPDRGARLIDVPYLSQTEDLCGGAALAMVLRYWGERQVFADDFTELVDRSAAGIRTDVLAAAVERRGWRALRVSVPATANADSIRHHLDLGRPVVALIEDRPGRYHYVVIVGWAGNQVIAHDPARTPFRVMSATDFERAWAMTGRWALLVLPPEGRSEPERPSAIAVDDTPGVPQPCDGLIQESVQRARAGDLGAAENGFLAATGFCPRSAAPWRELAGLRFLQQRWAEASRFAEHAVRLDGPEDRHDPHTWELLATSRFLNEELEGALEAWNRIDRLHLDLVNVDGAGRTRRPIVDGLLDVTPRTLLTANRFRQMRHRLEELPAAASTRVRYRPIDGRFAEVDATINEWPMLPWGLMPMAVVAGRTSVQRELRLDVASPTGSGEVWSAAWRFWDARPRVAFNLDVPAPGRLPGVMRVEAFWERQSYASAIGDPNVSARNINQSHRRRAALSFSDWATGQLRWEAGGALDRWGDDNHLSTGLALDLRLAGDRLSLGAAAAGWTPLQEGRRFVRAGISSAWRSTPDSHRPFWSASAGLTTASAAAPFDLWPGAGTEHAREPLLRAHPLLRDGVIEGPVFGRRVAHGSAEYQHPLHAGLWGRFRLAGFADAAKAWRRLDSSDASPIHVDVGGGLRVAAPGVGGTVRIDVARGLRDGRVVFSAGWVPEWPGRW